MTRFIPRIDPDGNILQIMATGAYSLNSIDFMSFLEILSETEFMMIQFLCRSVNGISIFSNSACDVSVLRLITTPKVQFNLMIDYNTSFDGVIEMHVLENTCYIMWINIPTLIAFSYFPIDEALIDTNEIKNKTLFMKYPNYYESAQFYGNYHLCTDKSSKMYRVVTLITILTKEKSLISLYNTTSSSFESLYFINIQGDISIDWIYYKNNTLIYILGYDNAENSQYSCTLASPQKDIFHVICGRLMIIINIDQNYSKIFIPVKYSISAISFYGDYLLVGLIDYVSLSSAIIYKSDYYLYFNSSCEYFVEILPNQTSLQYGVNLTQGIYEDPNIDTSLMTVMVYSFAQKFFNTSQTDIVIFDLFVNELFWPQTIASTNGSACQMTPPQIDSTQQTWSLSESNLILNYTPFYHCQGVPIKLTNVISSGIDSSDFQINNDKIIIQYNNASRILGEIIGYRDLQINPGDIITFNITAATNTKIPVTDTATISIYVSNAAPEYLYYPSVILAERPYPGSFQIIYGSLSDSRVTNSTIVTSDIDSDSIFIQILINGELNQQVPYKLNSQIDFESIPINTTKIGIGLNSLSIKMWDMFHSISPVQINITLNITYNPAPHFTEDLTENIIYEICIKSIIQFPEVQDLDNDFNKVKLINSQNWVEVDKLSLILNPTVNQLGSQQILFELVDYQNHTTQHPLNIVFAFVIIIFYQRIF